MSTIVIEELEGQRRTLTLVGPALPLRGASWGGEQRLVTTFPPGRGGEATQQVLGAVEEPSEWEGVWNTTRMVAAPSLLRFAGQETQITRAFTLMTTFEDVIRSGSLLRVTWATENRKIQREGRIGTYKFPVDREDDIRWNASFVWTSRGSGNEVSPVAQAEESVEASLRAVNQTLADIQSAIVGQPAISTDTSIPGSSSFITLGQLEQIAGAPRAFADFIGDSVAALRTNVSRTVGIIEKARSQPAQVAEVAATTARQTQSEMLVIQQRLGRTPVEVAVEPNTPVSGVARTAAYFESIGLKTDATIQQTIKTQSAAQKTMRAGDARRPEDQANAANVQQTGFARKGDTFAGLALRYYGTADMASILARVNGLPEYQVSPPVGMRLVFPNFTASDGQGMMAG